MPIISPYAINGLKADPKRQPISRAIRVVPDLPRPGVMFQDITTLLPDHWVFKDAMDIFNARYRDMDISIVSAMWLEARGFTFGPAIALAMAAKFVPLRKPKKLPGEVISESYVLDYGTDGLKIRVDSVLRHHVRCGVCCPWGLRLAGLGSAS
ncbi:adenine phosphoribosyltransferase 5-like [Eucalyptus grandis]|uniref:adenine phosphoribosyltransferase 5-like n=1 Tax=Eucalyptus grandis TaxID=71139 RepID=UPI00192EE3CF|nr:adenine phosphoribosyltransferase 5-like [Eucalyptus grandis]